ncbi:MAG TPA: PAS domain S-box protein [Methanomicrobiales archaeon]|nr:PAS domain S-box protein [Methanomicrobiales archaeon]
MAKARILVVEDEFITASDIQNNLVTMGYEVPAVVDTGEEAVRKAGELLPSLVLMDITLKGRMNGIEAAKQIRERFDIPIIYLTAHSDESTFRNALVSEPFGYIIKPFNTREMRISIEMALYKHALDRDLRDSEETNRVLLSATTDIMFLLDTEKRFLAANEALAKRAGVTVGALVGISAYDLVARKVLSPFMACWNISRAQKSAIQSEEKLNGRWFNSRIYPVISQAGEVIKYAVNIRDITKKKQMEEQLIQNEEYFRGLIENASDIIVVLNLDGSFIRESLSLGRALGIPQELLMGKKIFDIVHPGEVQPLRNIIADVIRQPYLVRPVRLTFRKGGGFLVIEGVMSNLTRDPIVQGIVLNGWAREA